MTASEISRRRLKVHTSDPLPADDIYMDASRNKEEDDCDSDGSKEIEEVGGPSMEPCASGESCDSAESQASAVDDSTQEYPNQIPTFIANWELDSPQYVPDKDNDGENDGSATEGDGENSDGENQDGENHDGENSDGENSDGENHDGENSDGENHDGENHDGENTDGERENTDGNDVASEGSDA